MGQLLCASRIRLAIGYITFKTAPPPGVLFGRPGQVSQTNKYRGLKSPYSSCGGSPEPGYPAITLPKLDVVPVDQLLCGFDRGAVILAIELDRPDEFAVIPNDINSILTHLRHPRRSTISSYAIIKIAIRRYGFGHNIKKLFCIEEDLLDRYRPIVLSELTMLANKAAS